MRILVLSPGFPVDGARYGHAVAEQVVALADRHEILVQSLSARPELPARRAPGPHAWRAGLPVWAPPLGGRARRLGQVWAWHRRRPPDLVWSLWLDRSGPAALALARAFRARWVASVMGGELADLPGLGYGGARTRRGRLGVQALLRAADRVTVGSEWLARRARALAPGRPVHVAPIGVEASTAPPPRRPWLREGPLELVTVTDAAPVKGAREVFAGLGALRARGVDARLTVFTLTTEAGRARLAGLASLAGVLDVVRLEPPTEARALRARLPALHALVSASHHESQGLALIEAALAGLPVVTPPVGVAEALADLGAARLCGRAPDALAAAIVGAAAETPDASARVAARFGLPATTARWSGLFEETAR